MVHRFHRCAVIGAVVVAEDGEDDGLSAPGGEIAAEGVNAGQRAGFCDDLSAKRAMLEPVRERTVYPADREAGAQFPAPGLMRGIDEQRGEGSGSDEVLRRKAGAVVELEVRRIDSGLEKELVDDARALRDRTVAAFEPPQKALIQFGVEVLAYLERHC